MRIAFFETEPWEEEYFRNHLGENQQLSFSHEAISPQTIDPETEILSPFIYSQLTSDILEKLPKVRLIATRSTGIDHIDSEYCGAHNIEVRNVPSYGVNTIAEHTFALILALSRHIVPSVERTRKGSFSLNNLRGIELARKNLGVIGCGAIGQRVIELARAFSMNVSVYSRSSKEISGVHFVDLETLLKESDIVSVHVPATPQTHHLLNTENIQLMKKGSILINTARGSIVQTEAIVKALETGILSGVGLDVLEEEVALKEERQLLTREFLDTGDVRIQLLNHVLLNRDEVLITPHNAFNSQEALHEILAVTAANIQKSL